MDEQQKQTSATLAKLQASSWDLFKESWKVLMENKPLLLFILINQLAAVAIVYIAVALGIVSLIFIKPIFLAVIYIIIVLLVISFPLSFVTLLTNAGLIICIMARMEGQSLSIIKGTLLVITNFWRLLRYMLGATASKWGIIAVQFGIYGLTGNFKGSASIVYKWQRCSYFLLPILMTHHCSLTSAIQQSSEIFAGKRYKVASPSIVLGYIVPWPLLFWGIAVYHLPAYRSSLIAIGIPALLILFVLIMAFGTALDTIICAALYLKAGKKIQPKHFDPTLLDSAIVFIKEQNKQSLDK